jgi:hypothetical protein
MKNLNIKGQNVFVDDEDFEMLSAINWNSSGENREYFIKSDGKRNKKEYLHRFLLGAKKGEVVDHINGQKFDNRKSNLRICTQTENHMNQRTQQRKKSSMFKGVGFHQWANKFRAYIKINGKARQLGLFNTQHDAAFAYDMKAFELFGKFAKPNLACSILHTIKPVQGLTTALLREIEQPHKRKMVGVDLETGTVHIDEIDYSIYKQTKDLN